MQTASYHFQLLAPPGTVPSHLSGPISSDPQSYEHYLSSLQRLRGQTYLADGAIGPEHLDGEGRHHMKRDEEAWHFLLVSPENEAVGCVRYLAHPPSASVDDLFISECPLSKDPVWGKKFRAALESDLAFARENSLTFVEVGGWAVDTTYRHTRAALEILLASFAWGRMIGGGLGCCTATFRNNSALMLRRIGGHSLEFENETIPPYSDSGYGCTMEVLRFHFQNFDPRFQKMVDSICARIAEQRTIARVLEDSIVQEDSSRTAGNLQALNRALHNANQTVVAPAASSLVS